jgi:hypothetical protein
VYTRTSGAERPRARPAVLLGPASGRASGPLARKRARGSSASGREDSIHVPGSVRCTGGSRSAAEDALDERARRTATSSRMDRLVGVSGGAWVLGRGGGEDESRREAAKESGGIGVQVLVLATEEELVEEEETLGVALEGALESMVGVPLEGVLQGAREGALEVAQEGEEEAASVAKESVPSERSEGEREDNSSECDTEACGCGGCVFSDCSGVSAALVGVGGGAARVLGAIVGVVGRRTVGWRTVCPDCSVTLSVSSQQSASEFTGGGCECATTSVQDAVREREDEVIEEEVHDDDDGEADAAARETEEGQEEQEEQEEHEHEQERGVEKEERGVEKEEEYDDDDSDGDDDGDGEGNEHDNTPGTAEGRNTEGILSEVAVVPVFGSVTGERADIAERPVSSRSGCEVPNSPLAAWVWVGVGERTWAVEGCSCR